jgi:endonuclease/exonuclease/phosphatase family metal-dependent hydrolase
MKVLVYNVKGFRAGVGVVADAVGAFRPDVALITECGSRRHLHRFAKRLGMKASHKSLFPLRRVPRNAVLVRKPLRVTHHRMAKFTDSQRFYPRGALITNVTDPGGREFTAASIHLGLLPAERKRHAEELVALLADISPPIILGGDLNDRPHSPAPALISKALWDVWLRIGESTGESFPSTGPEARIDYLFVSDDVRPLKAIVPAGEAFAAASDHLPLIADLAINLATNLAINSES